MKSAVARRSETRAFYGTSHALQPKPMGDPNSNQLAHSVQSVMQWMGARNDTSESAGESSGLAAALGNPLSMLPSFSANHFSATPQPKEASRFEAFRRLAQLRAAGEQVFLPRLLTGESRRAHVRQTIREDHRERIDQEKLEAKAKFNKLANSFYSFFRGTSLLFYRDMAGEDAWMPTVLTLGDIHPENFGVMPSSDNTPIFGVNDFDEAYYAPFSWDLKRGATGFTIAARCHGVSKKRCDDVVRALVHGYITGLEDFARDDSESEYQVRLDNSPPLIHALLCRAQRSREKWLRKYLGEKRAGFVASHKLVPQRSAIKEFQEVMNRYRQESHIRLPRRAGDLVVKDVARKKGSGTASLGLPRYYILIEGPSKDGTDDLILEMKRARRSSLAGLAPQSQYQDDSEEGAEADRVVRAQAVHLVGGDPFYGVVNYGGASFLVRERSPYKSEIELDGLSDSEWCTYASCCGRSLAQAHALADEAGPIEDDIEPIILEAIGNRAVFAQDIVRFARETAARLKKDHERFRRDHALGAFESIDRVYE